MTQSTAPSAAPVPAHPLLEAARAILPQLVDVRRRLHRVPELGLQLPQTQAIVAAELAAMGLEVRLGGTTTSCVAVIEGAHPGPAILLRADMDGLPLHEDTGLDFASETGQTMHACGHDTHMTMLLGAARLLLDRRDQLAGRVLLMFQPGEEGFKGAEYMLDEGLLEDGPHGIAGVERAFAIHITTHLADGVVGLRGGSLMAASDRLVGVVRGRGGHASAPHNAVDPITAAADLVLQLQTAITRNVDVFDPTVLTIARIAGGTTNNIIPERVEIEGTLRCVSDATRARMHALIARVAAGVGATHGVEISLEIDAGYPLLSNDPDVAEWILDLARHLGGDEAAERFTSPIMGAEDFAYVTQRVPGAMAFLGARFPGQSEEEAAPSHSNVVVFHEPSMAMGMALYAAAALDFLAPAAS